MLRGVRASVNKIEPPPLEDEILGTLIPLPQRLMFGNQGSAEVIDLLAGDEVQLQLLAQSSESNSNRYITFGIQADKRFYAQNDVDYILHIKITSQEEIPTESFPIRVRRQGSIVEVTEYTEP